MRAMLAAMHAAMLATMHAAMHAAMHATPCSGSASCYTFHPTVPLGTVFHRGLTLRRQG